MREPLSPYSGFVRSELTRMGFAESILGKIGAGAGNLRQAMNIPVEPSQNPVFLYYLPRFAKTSPVPPLEAFDQAGNSLGMLPREHRVVGSSIEG